MLLRRAIEPGARGSATILYRKFCGAAAGPRYTRATADNQPLLADERELWVSYADPATLRMQLVGIAQQVRESVQSDPLPEIVLPKGECVRHGFWFMRFSGLEHRDAAVAQLSGQPFQTACGSFSGTLQLDHGTRERDAMAMLVLPEEDPDPIEAWLHRRFGAYGTITSIRLPRLLNRWDQGRAFIRFSDPDEADAALEALDGTPSPIVGCNMFCDYKIIKHLRRVATHPADAAHAPPPSARAAHLGVLGARSED